MVSVTPRICGLMLAYFQVDMTRRCLSTLVQQGIERLILVDNSADDAENQRTLALARQFPDGWLQVIIAQENLGFARGMNLAWIQAQRLGSWDYVLVLNNDLVAYPALVSALLAHMTTHPRTAALGATTDSGHGPAGNLYYQRWTGLMFTWPIMGSFPVAAGYCLMLRATILRDTIFDARYFMYGEDVELSWRLQRQGWAVELLHQPLLQHKPGQSSRVGSLFYEYHVTRGHWLAVETLTPAHWEHLPMRGLRLFMLALRAVVRSGRCRCLVPLQALLWVSLGWPLPQEAPRSRP